MKHGLGSIVRYNLNDLMIEKRDPETGEVNSETYCIIDKKTKKRLFVADFNDLKFAELLFDTARAKTREVKNEGSK